ncbi:hypothetical protein B0H13DRAFT_2360191 [Mycena leptocephala]|nr:hypothetical protein B0H13DRAFT_2360191 [Mycena leptocephala]
MKLKSSLELDPAKRAAWCYVIDARLAKHDLKNPKVDKDSHINPFLQTWSPKVSVLTGALKEMVKCAQKLGVTFAALDPRKTVLLDLPLWHHLGEDPRKTQINNSARCRCLRKNHSAFKIRHAVEKSARLNTADHKPDPKCMCIDCVDDRVFKKCTNPHGCANMVKTRLDRLLPKYDPRLIIGDDADNPENPEEGTESSEERVFRNPKRLNNLTDGFRVFTNHPFHAISFTGATTRGGEENAAAGAGYWIDEDNPGNNSIKLPAAIDQTRPNAEFVATMVAVQTTPVDVELRLENPRGSVINA